MDSGAFPYVERSNIFMINFQHFTFARRRLPLFGIFIISCCVAWAQPDGPGGPPPDGPPPGSGLHQPPRPPSVEQELRHLTQLLTLTTDQQTQVKAILTSQHQQIDALLKPVAGDASSEGQPPSREAREAAHEAIKTIHEATRTKINAVLTDSQKVTYAASEKRHERGAARHEGDDSPPPPPGGENGPPPDGGGGPPGV
jgi:hypothetical protein